MDNNIYTNIDNNNENNIEKELIDNKKNNNCCNCNIFNFTGTCIFTFLSLLCS